MEVQSMKGFFMFRNLVVLLSGAILLSIGGDLAAIDDLVLPLDNIVDEDNQAIGEYDKGSDTDLRVDSLWYEEIMESRKRQMWWNICCVSLFAFLVFFGSPCFRWFFPVSLKDQLPSPDEAKKLWHGETESRSHGDTE